MTDSRRPRPPPRRDLRGGRGRAAVALAGDQARAVAGPDHRVPRRARQPADALPGDPPDRHQRQDLDLADDRHPAARARPAHRPVHQPARRADERADLGRRRAADRRGVRGGVQRRGAVHRASSTPSRPPAVVLRDRRRRWPTRGSPRRRSTWPWSRSGWAARGTRPTSPTARWRWCCPIAVDHARYLGDSPAEIAVEKAGIIKPGAVAVLAEQQPDVAEVLLARVAEVGATVVREGAGLRRRLAGARGRRPGGVAAGAARRATTSCSCRCTAHTRPRTPRWRWPRSRPSSAAASRSTTTWCGRRSPRSARPAGSRSSGTGPTILLDAAHNPHGAEAAAAALEDSFTLDPLIGVDRRDGRTRTPRGCWPPSSRTSPTSSCTQNSTDRAMPAAELAVVAVEVFGEDRVTVEPRLADAIDEAVGLAEAGSGAARSAPAACWSPARSSPSARRGRCCGGDGRDRSPGASANGPRGAACAPAVLSLEAITLGLTTPVLITIADVDTRGRAGRSGWGWRWPAC